tara:strand:+ start:519 stop:1685 length:1167 start_codon:yes stop_codon:yes gene_type:complete
MKVLAFSSIRSDYDLLSPLYKLIDSDSELKLKLIVSGAHLSIENGHTVDQIQKDGYDILLKIESLLASDSEVSRIKSASILLNSIIEPINNYNPDLMIYAGDREDVLMYSFIATFLKIPSIHFFSGDHASDGYVDNPVRHATSKLSSLHFVAIKEHKDRLIRMGESSKRIFKVGNIALDRFMDFKSVSNEKICNQLNINKNWLEYYCLVIFHPFKVEKDNYLRDFENIMKSLIDRNINAFVSSPNTDPDNFRLRKIISKYKSRPNFRFFDNLEREMFLSIYKNSKFIIGNSSSGIVEAASIPIPAINVGGRQKGRLSSENVVFTGGQKNQIIDAVNEVKSEEFLQKITKIKNPYGNGKSAKKAFKLIKSLSLDSFLLKKEDPLGFNHE